MTAAAADRRAHCSRYAASATIRVSGGVASSRKSPLRHVAPQWLFPVAAPASRTSSARVQPDCNPIATGAYEIRPMERVPQSHADMVLHLREQVEFLRASSAGYDGGNFAEAKRLATTARVLCHDTSASRSLLRQLGVLEAIRFVDTNTMGEERRVSRETLAELAGPADDDSPFFSVTMFESGLTPFGGYPSGLVAPLGDTQRFAPKPLHTWWNAPIIRDTPESWVCSSDLAPVRRVVLA